MAKGLLFLAAAASLTGSAFAACTPADSKTYDYIVVGSGAGGIVVADKLSEAGKSVLLLERGPPSTGKFNGTQKPSWLSNTNLTRYDVPGLFNQIWADGVPSCPDTGVQAGCVLGGGVAVNSALYWKPHPDDWDVNFPTGWKSTDMAKYTDVVFSRIPGTYIPSKDGKLYLQQAYDTVSKGLDAAGFKYVVANDNPTLKDLTYAHPAFYIANGERHGPLRSYLETAYARSNFALYTDSNVRRLVRTAGHVTGVEVQCNGGNGHSGTINVTPGTGRVILSAGTFGTARILFRSGIGPTDVLNVVKGSSTDGSTMISTDQWINLPVGNNVNDHVGTDIQISHPNVVNYDFYGAWSNPVASDKDAYINKKSGALTVVAPNLGPIAWTMVNGTDGKIRHIQWQMRVEGRSNTAMTITQYLGMGTTSRGKIDIQANMNTRVVTAPYLRDAADKQAAIDGLEAMRGYLNKISGVSWITPTTGQTSQAFINSVPATIGSRNSNHWVGSATMGTDDGRTGGKAVVDLDTKVYGTDNLFVVDASIFPGITTGNPSAAIFIAAEKAADRILALATPKKGRGFVA